MKMKQESKNTFLATAVVAGLLSLPMTWMTLHNQTIFGGLIDGRGVNFNATAFNGHLTFLVKTPLWFVVSVAVAASVLQFMHSSKSFSMPAALQWGIAGIAVFWMGLASWSAIASDQATPGIGLFLGLYCAVIPLAMLCVETEPSDDEETSTPEE